MTVIVASSFNQTASIAGDSGVFDDSTVVTTAIPKVWRVDDSLIGVSGTFRDIDTVRQLNLSDPYAIRDGLIAEYRANDSYEATVLIANEQGVWYVDSNFAVIKSREPYGAIGAGSTVALGALWVFASQNDLSVSTLRQAVQASVQHHLYARPPIKTLTIAYR